MLQEVGAGAKVVILTMFQNEERMLTYKPRVHHAIGQFAQFGQSIGRVGKYEIEGLDRTLYEAQRIATHGRPGIVGERARTLLNEGIVATILLNRYHAWAAARKQFERDATCATEEVERTSVLKVEISTEHVEEILLGKVGRRTSLEGAGHFKVTTFIFSCNDTHRDDVYENV